METITMKTRLFTIALTLFFAGEAIAQSSPSDIKALEWNAINDANLAEDTTVLEKLSNDLISFKGGLILEGNNKTEFGGLSGIMVFNDGKTMVAISDYTSKSDFEDVHRSKWFQFDLEYKHSVLRNAHATTIGQMKDASGNLIPGELEDMAWGNQMTYISADDTYKILCYETPDFDADDKFKKVKQTLELQPQFPHVNNAGIEALTLTNDNELLAIYEMNQESNDRHAWLLNPETGDSKYFTYHSALEDIKSLTTLQNGDIVVLEKTWTGSANRIKIVIIKQQDLGKNEVNTTSILELESKAIDNFEGIASYTANGKEYLLMVSDDNGDNLDHQKSLLLHFELLLDGDK
jgi:hypothetical protein